MKQWRKRRALAVLLVLATFLTAAIPFTATAAKGSSGNSETEELYGGRTMEEILNLIGGTTYNRYSSTHSNKETASDVIIVDSDDIVYPNTPDNVDGKTGEERTTADFEIITDPAGVGINQEIDLGGASPVYTPNSGKITYKVTVPASGMYAIDMLYYPISSYKGVEVGTKTTIERMFMIDGALPFNECRYLYIPRCWEYVGTDGKTELYREGEPKRADFADDAAYNAAYTEWAKTTGGAGNYLWDKDVESNDIRPDRVEAAEWRVYFLRDWLGYTVEPFQFYLEEGTHYLTFEATREPLVIGQIKLYGYDDPNNYEYQIDKWLNNYNVYEGENSYRIEAESPDRVSDQVLFPGTDRTSCINSPSNPRDLVYNVSNSNVVGQYMRYNVYVEEEGLYNIMIRFRQNTMAGMFTSRRIRINGEIPFKEASYLRFNYDTTFQNQLLGYENADGEFEECLFYLKEGWNTVELEVVLGDMSSYIYEIAEIIDILNTAYEEILKITGTNPDTYRDYGFARLIPGTISDMASCALRIGNIYDSLVEITGETGQHVATLDTIKQMISRMARDEYEIAPNFLNFKNYLTSLSNWLYTSLSQPLKVDYLQLQADDAKVAKSSANFFVAAWYETKSFFASFFKNYNVIGFANDANFGPEMTINMWNTTSREDALILRTMIDASFTPYSGIAVRIKYVAQGLQESILAGVGPDVAMMGSGTAVSWGLRHAVSNMAATDDAGNEVFAGFREIAPKDENGEFLLIYDEANERYVNRFSPAAMEAVSLTEPGTTVKATYALPTTMNFEMAFYRIDVFAEYDFAVPRTWQELIGDEDTGRVGVLPAMTNQHMTMGMQTSLAGYQMLLYQMGDEMYAEDYKRFNDNVTAITAFDTLCSLFQDYSLPISYDLTRFRTGEIPIVVANWTTYNTFMGYYELRGLWTMESLLGWEYDYDNDGIVDYVDRSSILNLDGIVIPRGTDGDKKQKVWEYIKWYTGEDAQSRLARQQLAASGNTTVKYNTANLNALLNQAWTPEEIGAIKDQITYLKGIPYNPGDYNISRYVEFAFLAVYNSNANAVDSLLNYVVDIDKELARKRKEYHLPYEVEKGKEPVTEEN